MKIKNFKDISTNKLRTDALSILEEGLSSIDTKRVMDKNFRLEENTLYIKGKGFDISKYKNIFLIGVGKSSLSASEVIEKKIGERIKKGVILDIEDENNSNLKKVKYLKGDHPYPTERNVEATTEIISILKEAEGEDLVISIISGGGSALLCQPTDFEVSKEKYLVQEMFKAGVGIEEINTIRKHLSSARGGNLAFYAHPALMISLVFSDVPGDNLEFIASGPTVKDTTTAEDAKEILINHNLWQKVGFSFGSFVETPKNEKYFKNIENILFVSNKTALQAMSSKANELGFSSRIIDTKIRGEAREVANLVLADLKEEGGSAVLLYGGETTVTILGEGEGGRNQELALSALREIEKGEIVISCASDGIDNSEYAGAVADFQAKEKADKLGIKPEAFLARNDSYNFFKKTGDFIETGTTGSNIADLIIALKM